MSVEKGHVHFAVGIREESKVNYFFGHRVSIGRGVCGRDAHQNKKAAADPAHDFAIYADLCTRYSL